MTARANTNADRAAIGVSLACMAHCLLLPVLAALTPFGIFGVMAENDWHWLFVALAAPISLYAALRAPSQHRALLLIGVAVGLGFLLAGALAADHDWQVGLTLVGAVTLAAAHLRNLRQLAKPSTH